MKLKITSKYFYTGNISPSKKKEIDRLSSYSWKILTLGTGGALGPSELNPYTSGRIALWDLVDE